MSGSGQPAEGVSMSFGSGTTAQWVWIGGEWRRNTNGSVHSVVLQDGEVQRLAVDTIVVIESNTYIASPSGSGSSVPATETTGSGKAWVFHGGRYLTGSWAREEITDPFTLTRGSGGILNVPPGRLWVALFPEGNAFTVDDGAS
jgi:hypothetical protein